MNAEDPGNQSRIASFEKSVSWFAPRTKRVVRGANNDDVQVISRTLLIGERHLGALVGRK